MPNNKCRIAFSHGTGGRWLDYMLWTLENGYTELAQRPKINYHDLQQSSYFYIEHNDTGEPWEYVFSSMCRFNLFLNGWKKFRVATNYEDFNEKSIDSQIAVLSDEASWRMMGDCISTYEYRIDLDYKYIITDSEKFRAQLISLLQQESVHHWPQEYLPRVTEDFVAQAVEQFRSTVIPPRDHLGNVESTGWLGWCDGLCRANNIDIPVSISDDINGYKCWLKENEKMFVDLTMPYTVL